MTTHDSLLHFLASPGVQAAYAAEPGRAFVSDITFPEGLTSAKLYVSARAPLFQPSAWWAPLRAAGFAPSVALAGRFLAALRACGATGARPWNLQATWNARDAAWEPQAKIYLRCEHLPPMDAATLRTLWEALGATPAQADTLAQDGAGVAIEGVACTLGADGLPLVFETYLQGEGTGYDCISVERTPDGVETTCFYTPVGARCTPADLALWLRVDEAVVAALCALLPDPTPSAVAVVKTTPGQPDRQGVCVQTVPAQPGADL